MLMLIFVFDRTGNMRDDHSEFGYIYRAELSSIGGSLPSCVLGDRNKVMLIFIFHFGISFKR